MIQSINTSSIRYPQQIVTGFRKKWCLQPSSLPTSFYFRSKIGLNRQLSDRRGNPLSFSLQKPDQTHSSIEKTASFISGHLFNQSPKRSITDHSSPTKDANRDRAQPSSDEKFYSLLKSSIGNPNLLEFLLGSIASENERKVLLDRRSPVDGNTLLHAAVGQRMSSSVKILLEAGADPNALNDRGQTPLDMAMEKKATLPSSSPQSIADKQLYTQLIDRLSHPVQSDKLAQQKEPAGRFC